MYAAIPAVLLSAALAANVSPPLLPLTAAPPTKQSSPVRQRRSAHSIGPSSDEAVSFPFRPTRMTPAPPSLPVSLPHRPSLPNLPEHVWLGIATHSEELEIWRLMATSRGMRHAVEPALKHFLKEKTVVLDPPVFDNALAFPHYPTPQRKTPAALVEHHARFQAHLDAYLLSTSLLRRLVVEVREDSSVGWDLIQRFSKQLEALVLHSTEERWTQQGEEEVRSARTGLPLDKWDVSIDTYLEWAPPCPGPTDLPNLSELTIAATAGILSLLDYFFPLAPNLRRLSLSCFCGDGGTSYTMDMPPLKSVERLSIAGYWTMVMAVARSLRDRLPDLRYLTVRLDDSRRSSAGPEWTDWVLESTVLRDQLEGVALYGAAVYEFSRIQWCQQDAEGAEVEGCDFDNLTTLVLEEQVAWTDEGKEAAYPILGDMVRPELPAIKRITYVDRRLDKARRPRGSAFAVELYNPAALRMLFQEYPTLEYVQWVNDYPADPFADDFGPEFRQAHLLDHVRRDEMA